MSEAAAESEATGRVEVGRRSWPRSTSTERAGQAVLLVVALGGIALGMALVPSPEGHGTHGQLGLPPCGMMVTTGRPCPTCGVTTAYVLAAHGRFVRALVTQPFGLACFVLTVAAAVALAAALVARRSLMPLVTTYGVAAPAVAMLLLALASWAYKWWTL